MPGRAMVQGPSLTAMKAKQWRNRIVSALFRTKSGGLSGVGNFAARFVLYLSFLLNNERLAIANKRVPSGEFETTEPLSGIVYDVGANNGDDTDYYLMKKLRVIAIEANACQAERIASRFPSQLESGDLMVLNLAVGICSGKARFYVNLLDDKMSSLIAPQTHDRNWKVEQVDAKPLSEVVR